MEKLIFKNSRGQSITLGNTGPFLLEKIDGTGSPKTTILTSKAPGQDGRSHHGTILDERILPVQGAIFGNSTEDMYRKKKELCAVLNPKTSGKLTYINDIGSYEVDYTVEDISFKDRLAELQGFLAQLYCPNPFWLENYEESEEIATWIGGIKFMLRLPVRFSTRGPKQKLIINNGDVETPITIVFKGPATNPKVTNLSTGEFIQVKRTLENSDSLIISTDFGHKRVEIEDGAGNKTNVFNWITLDSTFFNLQMGDNIIQYSSDNDIEPAAVYIKYRNRYIGV